MSVAVFLAELRRLDVRIWTDGDSLRCSAPPGALTGELREALRERKSDILSFLRMADGLAAQQRALVPLQPRGTRAPIFAVPGHSGDVFCYRALAHALGDDQPFFGLQPPGVDGRTPPLARVEDLAAHFEAQIRAFRPQPPWIVAGFCAGGAVAFELARRLLGSDDAAGFLALFGAPHPHFYRPARLALYRLENRLHLWRKRARIWSAQSAAERLAYLRWRVRRVSEAPDTVIMLRAKVEAAWIDAVRVYQPRAFGGRVFHFPASKAWARSVKVHRWDPVAQRATVLHGPDGCTGEDMLDVAHAPEFARHLRRAGAQAGF